MWWKVGERTLRHLSVPLIVASSLAFGCTGRDESGTPPSGAPSPSAETTPIPQATIEGTSFVDPMGYAATVPMGWTAYDNKIVAGDLITDIFFSPEQVDEVQPNISVTCDRLEQPTTLQQFIAEHRATLEGLNAKAYTESSDRTIGSTNAAFVTYELDRSAAQIHKEEYLFISGECAWIVAATVPLSDAGTASAILDEFVRSMTLAG